MKFSRNKSMSLRGDDLFWFSLGDFNERRGRISCQPGNRARETERGIRGVRRDSGEDRKGVRQDSGERTSYS